MSIATEISRLQTAKENLKASIENKGVEVSAYAKLDEYPAYVDMISGGGTYPIYDGPYTYTPTQQRQTISIAEKAASQDIIINPIPSCYGLITWDGSSLTVT